MARRIITLPLATACLLICGVLAQAQDRPYRGTYQSVRQTILRLENGANLFRNSVDNWSRRTSARYGNEDVNVTARDFNDSVRQLRDRFDQRVATTSDVQDVLNRAARIDDFMHSNSVDPVAQNYWSSMRVDLNDLATAYNLSWQTSSYNQPYNNPNPTYGYPAYGNQYGIRA